MARARFIRETIRADFALVKPVTRVREEVTIEDYRDPVAIRVDVPRVAMAVFAFTRYIASPLGSGLGL